MILLKPFMFVDSSGIKDDRFYQSLDRYCLISSVYFKCDLLHQAIRTQSLRKHDMDQIMNCIQILPAKQKSFQIYIVTFFIIFEMCNI